MYTDSLIKEMYGESLAVIKQFYALELTMSTISVKFLTVLTDRQTETYLSVVHRPT
jgi:hypothetical protein